MGASLSACANTAVVSATNFPKALVVLPKDQKPPNFMQKIGLTCIASFASNDTNASMPPSANLYAAVVEYDWGMVVPLILAVLLVLILIGYLIMKMRHHSAPAMVAPMMDGQ